MPRTNYEDRVPESLRKHTAAAFQHAVEDRKAHPAAEGFVQSLVLAAYTWQHPPASSDKIFVEIPGMPVLAEHPTDCRWNAERTDQPYTYRIIGAVAPHEIFVEIQGLDAPPFGTSTSRYTGSRYTKAPLWRAKKGHSGRSDIWHGSEPIYLIEGDPNAVAVGRFKAGLRKFLGLQE